MNTLRLEHIHFAKYLQKDKWKTTESVEAIMVLVKSGQVVSISICHFVYLQMRSTRAEKKIILHVRHLQGDSGLTDSSLLMPL